MHTRTHTHQKLKVELPFLGKASYALWFHVFLPNTLKHIYDVRITLEPLLFQAPFWSLTINGIFLKCDTKGHLLMESRIVCIKSHQVILLLKILLILNANVFIFFYGT